VHLRYPFEGLGNLSKEILAERLTKFYQELKQDDGREYSRSAHVAIRARINRYLTSGKVGKTFSIISDPILKTANKSLNAKLKKSRNAVRPK
jgi:Tfp pilus assembly pilus retraction ATPase PilT